ncbi:MAG: hypothetical protein M3Q58_05625 [Bacteroidota bacterium]|nr:hypothetical protein [Bacteroidota bacterium]
MNKRIIFLSLFIVLFSCKKEEYNIVNLNGSKIVALGHGGMGISSTYPMNSKESILNSLNIGMDGTEIDVQMTKDGVLVAYHNLELSENTNLDGMINSKTWAELEGGFYITTPYLQYSIVSLNQLFSGIKNLNEYQFVFDCKLYADNNKEINEFYNDYISAMVDLIKKFKLQEKVYIESQNTDFLLLLKTKEPAYRLFIYPSTFESGLETALSLNLYGITISTRNITREQIKTAHSKGLFVAIWNTQSQKDNIEAINKNPDFIQTDKLKNLLKLLK